MNTLFKCKHARILRNGIGLIIVQVGMVDTLYPSEAIAVERLSVNHAPCDCCKAWAMVEKGRALDVRASSPARTF